MKSELEFVVTPAWKRLMQIFMNELSQMYFCGYNLLSALDRGLFEQLSHYAHGHFCYELSGITMLAFPVDGAKLVQGIATVKNPHTHELEIGSHAIVQVDFYGESFIVDLAWFNLQPVPKWNYSELVDFQPMWQIEYDDFWCDPVVEKLSRLFREQLSSNLLAELAYFRPERASAKLLTRQKDYGFSPTIGRAILRSETSGRKFVPYPTPAGLDITQGYVDSCMSFQAVQRRLLTPA